MMKNNVKTSEVVARLKADLTADASNTDEPVSPAIVDDSRVSAFDEQGRKSQATILIELTDGLELFHDADDNGYAIVPKGLARQVLPIRQKVFRDYLSRSYYEQFKKGVGSQAIQDAIDSIEARAKFDGQRRDIFLRVAAVQGRVYIDLCDEQWRVVEVAATGWQVLGTSPVMFVRKKDMRPLPAPEHGGNIEALRQFVNVKDAQWPLIYGWLLAALRGTGPYPVLVLQGEQGTGKSTSSRALKELIDPAGAALLSPPRTPSDLSVIAANMHVIALDNLSGLSPEMSDGICRISTGGGTAKRKLYTDNDLESVNLMRPVMVNGIDDIATRADLMSRSLQQDLPMLPDASKASEARLWSAYESKRAGILGALLSMLCHALDGFDREQAQGTGRLRDLQRLVTAAERGSGMALRFQVAYQESTDEGVMHSIESSAFASAIVRLIEKRKYWTGTATELLSTLDGLVDDRTRKSIGWPQSNRAIGNALQRAAPSLRAIGVESANSRTGESRLIRLDWVGKTSSLTSSSSQPSNGAALSHDYVAHNYDALTANMITPTQSIATSSSLKRSKGEACDDDDANDDKSTTVLNEVSIPNHGDGIEYEEGVL